VATLINNGYLKLTNSTDILLLACEKISADFKMKPKIKHQPGGNHYGYDLGIKWLEWKAESIIFDSHTDWSTCIDTLKDWQLAGTFTLSVIRDGSNNEMEFDGDNSTYTVLLKNGLKQLRALSITQFSDKWVIGSIIFEQAG